VQSKYLDELKTRVAAPLVVGQAFLKLPRTNPIFLLNGQTAFLSPTELATFSLTALGKPIANLESERDRIVAALDLVFTGV
jgi:hypothetical protein